MMDLEILKQLKRSETGILIARLAMVVIAARSRSADDTWIFYVAVTLLAWSSWLSWRSMRAACSIIESQESIIASKQDVIDHLSNQLGAR